MDTTLLKPCGIYVDTSVSLCEINLYLATVKDRIQSLSIPRKMSAHSLIYVCQICLTRIVEIKNIN